MTALQSRPTQPDLPDRACRDADPNLFTPDTGDFRAAKAICRTCPTDTRKACLAYALRAREPHGVYGGLDPRQRAQLIP